MDRDKEARVAVAASSPSGSDGSDGDDDMETLISRNESPSKQRLPSPSRRPRRRGSFEIADLKARIHRPGARTCPCPCPSTKCLAVSFAVFIPLVLLVAYFGGAFRHDSSQGAEGGYVAAAGGAVGERMREAELRALYLLRNQQAGLLRLWNRTYGASAAASVPPQSAQSTATPILPPPANPTPTSTPQSTPAPPSNPTSTPTPPSEPASPTPAAPAGSANSNATAQPTNSTAGVRHDQVIHLSAPVIHLSEQAVLPTVSFEEFREALLEQIRLNREIQKVLLSTHQSTAAALNASLDDNADSLLSGAGDVCRKVGLPGERRTVEWKPRKNRYLLAICLSGQMSNHLICLEKHMFFAALLGRTLVIPSPKVDYQYDKVIDVDHINGCFGRKVVVPFDEFAQQRKNKMHIDKFICYMANPPCFVDDEHGKRLRSLGLSLPKLMAAWPEDAKSQEQKKRVAGDITSRFASDDDVIAVGDLFYADVEAEWVMQPGGPLAHKCKTLIRPSKLITLTAERFVQTFLGSNFIALHFRRHGFLKFCNAKEESCFFSVPQAAECILRVVEKTNAPVIYLSTDAADSETNLLQSLVVLNDKIVPLVKRPDHTSVEKWDALLYRNHLGGDNQVEAMLDKTICAMASVFIGSSGSTFTDDILRLRKDWGSASVCDEYLCQGQQPNFIATKE